MDKKKICIVGQFAPPIHGLSKALDTICNSYLREDFELEVIDIKDNKKIFRTLWCIIKSNADMFYFTISQSRGGNLRDLLILKTMSLKKKHCLIHLHGGYYKQLLDNDLPKWQRDANYRAISRLDGVIVLGDSLKYIFEGMISTEKIFVVPNCVDDEYLISDNVFEEKMASLNNERVKQVLYLSNFIKTKGYPEVLEMAKMHKKFCDVGGMRKYHFHFAGDFFKREEKEFFFNAINEYGLKDYVTYHGIVKGDEKLELLKKCDIFVLLTRYKIEGQPISIIEAMANGMTVLTTDHAGIPDLIKDRENGVVLRKLESIDDIYDKIDRLDLKRIAMKNRADVYEKYLQIHYLKNIEKVWKRVLN